MLTGPRKKKFMRLLYRGGLMFGISDNTLYRVTFKEETGLVLEIMVEGEWAVDTDYNWGITINRFSRFFKSEEELNKYLKLN